ncbi:histidine kinase [Microlunatus sp. Y2014]|uniref:histidine kinase n=1 Tax=Microlunatus sp. Y2014 TaxID=3418488 RepID=UPI003DA73517
MATITRPANDAHPSEAITPPTEVPTSSTGVGADVSTSSTDVSTSSTGEGVSSADASACEPIPPMMLRLIPIALAIVSWVIGWALAGIVIAQGPVAWSAVPLALLIMMRIGLERNVHKVKPGSRVAVIFSIAHGVITLVGVTLNPFVCVYAFVGYLDAGRFLQGLQERVLVAATALLCAFGQAGSLPGVSASPVLFVGLALVNGAIALAMVHVAELREREVKAREDAVEELLRVTEENASLQHQLLEQARTTGISEERARLSREIHDTVAQGLVGVIRQLEALPDTLDGPAQDRVARAETAARECLVEARRAVHAMAPQQLRDAGLVEAVGELAASWSRTHRVVIEFDADSAPTHFDHGPVLLRVVQEALANVARHAAADTVTVVLDGSADLETVTVTDDGRGFDRTIAVPGHGLRGMAERVEALGGHLDITSAPGRGTTITATVPR